MLVNLPAAPVDVAAMPVADAAPVSVSAAVVAATAPQPMTMRSGEKIHYESCDLGLGSNAPPAVVPPPLGMRGVSPSDWGIIKQHIEEHIAGNGFKHCACMELVCTFTCCCGCVGFIPFVMIGKYEQRKKVFYERRIPEINARLAPHGIYAKFEVSFGEALVFYTK